MFTIMENRKRPRFEMIDVDIINSNEAMEGVASTTTSLGTATLATIGGQSFILNNSANTPLPANILLSICDDNSNESEEYILDHSTLACGEQEPTVTSQTINNKNQAQQVNLVTTAPQYRIISQGKPLNSTSPNSATINSSAGEEINSLLSSNLNFPPGCEIYVVKEVFDTAKQAIAESTRSSSISPKMISGNSTTIKLEPISPLSVPRQSTVNGKKTLNPNSNSNINISNTSAITSNIISTSHDETAKRSLILDAYKRRDDKRRATHNEVERRRRDKINSLIFKLKEMLPSEATSSNSSSLSHTNQNTFTNNSSVQPQITATNTRSPSNDSKSQILIRACEYIKSMKEEITSLRECLTENENLRLKNEHLQDEINSLRSKQQQQEKLHNNSNILLTTNTTNSNNNNKNSDNSDDCEITLNSLNTTYANVQLFTPSTNHHHLSDLVGLTRNSNTTISTPNSVNVTYAKRELIITDYVD